MVYIVPRRYKCLKCGFEMKYSPSHSYNFLPVKDGRPFCYQCLIMKLLEEIPLMEEEK